jgi:hypothetical protein
VRKCPQDMGVKPISYFLLSGVLPVAFFLRTAPDYCDFLIISGARSTWMITRLITSTTEMGSQASETPAFSAGAATERGRAGVTFMDSVDGSDQKERAVPSRLVR